MEEQHLTPESTPESTQESVPEFIPKNNHVCPNCNSTLGNEAAFCPKCGQKNTDGRLTVKELFSQFFDNIFNLNSKIFQTLGSVFIPGKLTNAFLNGQRQKYYHPIRLFLVLILIALAGFKYQGNFSPPTKLSKEYVEKIKERKRLMEVFDSSVKSISEKTDQHTIRESLDSLSNTFYDKSGRRIDSININSSMNFGDTPDFYIALEDLNKYSSEEILEKYEVKGFFYRLTIQQKLKMIEKTTSFIPFVLGKVTWAVFFVLLLLTLIFKLLYLRKDILYLEHLIFGIHLNSFFLIIATILTLLSEEKIENFIPWAILLMAIYLFIAMKRVYKQSYIVTILKFVPISICYFFSFIFGIVLTVIGSFLIF